MSFLPGSSLLLLILILFTVSVIEMKLRDCITNTDECYELNPVCGRIGETINCFVFRNRCFFEVSNCQVKDHAPYHIVNATMCGNLTRHLDKSTYCKGLPRIAYTGGSWMLFPIQFKGIDLDALDRDEI